MSKPKLIIKNSVIKSAKIFRKAGEIGLSEVSEAIQNEFGHIIGRSQRRKIAKNNKKPFIIFTTQVGKRHLLPHQVGRQLIKAAAYKAKITDKKWRKAAGER
jgi:hypothetical protein